MAFANKMKKKLLYIAFLIMSLIPVLHGQELILGKNSPQKKLLRDNNEQNNAAVSLYGRIHNLFPDNHQVPQLNTLKLNIKAVLENQLWQTLGANYNNGQQAHAIKLKCPNPVGTQISKQDGKNIISGEYKRIALYYIITFYMLVAINLSKLSNPWKGHFSDVQHCNQYINALQQATQEVNYWQGVFDANYWASVGQFLRTECYTAKHLNADAVRILAANDDDVTDHGNNNTAWKFLAAGIIPPVTADVILLLATHFIPGYHNPLELYPLALRQAEIVLGLGGVALVGIAKIVIFLKRKLFSR